ncbi:MAG: TraB/GumN family protein [Bacteroidota bacterium]
MKQFVVLPLFFSFLFGIAAYGQENNKSLLWEISGNGLQKNSYLYGTMHVSDRVSYHLTDAFFEHLLQADIVATESNFEEWAKLDELLNNPAENFLHDMWGMMEGPENPFYSSFRVKPLQRQDILNHFMGITYSTNNLLFRTSAHNQDFQEQTYLDMFIFQVGKKLNKKTVGLERVKESFAIMHNINYEDFEMPSEQTVQAMMKILKNRTPEEALSDFYREKDIEIIYRFMELAMPLQWRNQILYKRNETMVKSIDSLARTGSLFATMGVAHLAGEKGAIAMLRDMGYTVTPVHDEYTDWGREKKKEIDDLVLDPQLEVFTSYDHMVSLPMFSLLLHNGANTSSPDLVNGGAINLKRTPLNDFVVKPADRFNHLSLDSLFFENIPGQIISKEFVEHEHLKYYDIRNTTRSGNHQRYRFYLTPLELITVSIIGPGDYTTRFEDEVFSDIAIEEPSENWETITPSRGGFTVSLPAYHTIYGSKKNPTYPEDIEIQAFDPTNHSFYFLSVKRPGDFLFEDSGYELERIQKEFYTQYDASEYTITNKTANTLTSKSKMHGKDIYLMTAIHGNFYYLTGCIECSQSQQEKLFSSFSLVPYVEDTDFRLYEDKKFGFSLEVPFKQNELLFMGNTPDERVKPLEKNQWFSSDEKTYSFYSANGHKVELFTYRYHPYQTEASVDSLFYRLNRRYLQNQSNLALNNDTTTVEQSSESDTEDYRLPVSKSIDMNWETSTNARYFGAVQAGPVMSVWEQELGIINMNPWSLNDVKQYHVAEGDYHVFEGYVRREGTLGQLRRMMVFKDGMGYRLETVVPENYQNDNTFVERLFGSFSPSDTIFPYSVMENKLPLFLEHLKSDNDSIKASALSSADYLIFEASNIEIIQEILDVLELKNEDTDDLKVLLEKIAAVDHPQIHQFVQDAYLRDDLNSTLRISLLSGLAQQQNEQAYKMIMELIDQYLPIPEKKNEIAGLFREFEDNIRYSQALVPWVFDLIMVEEYKTPVLHFGRELTQSQDFDSRKLEPVKDMLLANAKLEFRRTRSWVNNRKGKKEKTQGYDAVRATRNLNTYLHLIYPFIEEERFAKWWAGIHDLAIPEIHLEMLNLELNQKKPDAGFANELLQREETLFAATVLLSGKAPDFPLPQANGVDLARSGVVLLDHVDLENQTLTFYQEKTLTHNDKTIRFYFFTCKDKKTPKTQMEETILMSKGFVLDDKGEIMPGAFFSGLQKPIQDPEKIEEYIFEVIDQSLNWNNDRANYMKNNYAGAPLLNFDLF